MSTPAAIVIKDYNESKAVHVSHDGDERVAAHMLAMANTTMGGSRTVTILDKVVDVAISAQSSIGTLGSANHVNQEDSNEPDLHSVLGSINTTEAMSGNNHILTSDTNYLKSDYDYVYVHDKTVNYPHGEITMYIKGEEITVPLGELSSAVEFSRFIYPKFQEKADNNEYYTNMIKKAEAKFNNIAQMGLFDLRKEFMKMEYRNPRDNVPSIETDLDKYGQPVYEEGRIITSDMITSVIKKNISIDALNKKTISKVLKSALEHNKDANGFVSINKSTGEVAIGTKQNVENTFICELKDNEIIAESLKGEFKEYIRLNHMQNIHIDSVMDFKEGDEYTMLNGQTGKVLKYTKLTGDVDVEIDGQTKGTNIYDDIKVIDVDFNGGGTSHDKAELINDIIDLAYKYNSFDRILENNKDESIQDNRNKIDDVQSWIIQDIKNKLVELEGDSSRLHNPIDIIDDMKHELRSASPYSSLHVKTTLGEVIIACTEETSFQKLTKEAYILSTESRLGTNNDNRLKNLGEEIIQNIISPIPMSERGYQSQSQISKGITEKIIPRRFDSNDLEACIPEGVTYKASQPENSGYYISYNGQEVEHYNYIQEGILSLEKLANSQKRLELKGGSGAHFNSAAERTGKEKYTKVIDNGANFKVDYTGNSIVFDISNRYAAITSKDGSTYVLDKETLPEYDILYHHSAKAGFFAADTGNKDITTGGVKSAQKLNNLLEEYNVPLNILEYTKDGSKIISIDDFHDKFAVPKKDEAYVGLLKSLSSTSMTREEYEYIKATPCSTEQSVAEFASGSKIKTLNPS